jgi:Xaa-Pro aminopeptidase
LFLTILPSLQEVTCISPSPVSALKSIKNSIEIEGFRQSHIRDGAALARYFAWLEEQLEHGVELNESQGADQLEKFRSYVPRYFNLNHAYPGLGNWICFVVFHSPPSRQQVQMAVSYSAIVI